MQRPGWVAPMEINWSGKNFRCTDQSMQVVLVWDDRDDYDEEKRLYHKERCASSAVRFTYFVLE